MILVLKKHAIWHELDDDNGPKNEKIRGFISLFLRNNEKKNLKKKISPDPVSDLQMLISFCKILTLRPPLFEKKCK